MNYAKAPKGSDTFKWAFRIIGLVILLGILAIMGTCYFQNCREDTGPKPPPVDKAAYSVTIKATGKMLYTNEVLKAGNAYALRSYWEINKGKWVYHDMKSKLLILDEDIFGPIEVKRR